MQNTEKIPTSTDVDSKELKALLAKQIQEIHEQTEAKLQASRDMDQTNSYDHSAYYRGGINE